MNTSVRKINIIITLFIIITGCIIYINSIDAPFAFDDHEYINDPSLQMSSLTFENIVRGLRGGEAKRRPVSNLSIALNYLINKSNVRGYHIFNITIHICAAIILYFLALTTLSLPSLRGKYRAPYLISFFASVIWLVHPLATQSVTYIIQRMNSMSAMFILLSLLLYAKARIRQHEPTFTSQYFTPHSWLFTGSFLSALLAIGSKEIAAILPLIILLYEWFFFQDLSIKWIYKKSIWLIIACMSVTLFIVLFLGKNPIASIIHSCDNRSFTTIERLLTELRIVVHYLSLILYPSPDRLTFDYNYTISTSIFKPITTLYSLLFLSALCASSILLARKERLISFCIIWFLLTLVIESSVICLELIFEHRTYLPSSFLILGFTAFLFELSRRRGIALLLLIPIATTFSLWTIERNKVWQDPLTFWNDTNKKQPNNPRAILNTGNLYFHKNELLKAKNNYLRALTIQPDMRYAIKNLGITLLKLGQYDEAEYYFKKGLELEPKWVDMYNNLATVSTHRQEYNKAIALLRNGLALAPTYPLLNKNMGRTLLRTGRVKLAVYFLKQAIAYENNDIPLLLDLAEATAKTGQIDESIDIYFHTLALAPHSVIAHYNLAQLLAGYNSDEAKSHYEKSVKLAPYSVPAMYNLANIYFREGELQKAKDLYQQIVAITPELADTYNNYGLLLTEEGNVKEAIPFFEQALRIMPDHQFAPSNLENAKKRLEAE